MHLEGDGGRSFDLSVVGYQFAGGAPEPGEFDFDANWLVVHGQANDGDREWQFRSPCMLTTEARQLTAWLEAVASGWRDLDPTDFIEPILEFRRVSAPEDPPTVRVTFRLEARPPWADELIDDDWDGIWLEFDVSPETLATAASDLRNELRQYPER